MAYNTYSKCKSGIYIPPEHAKDKWIITKTFDMNENAIKYRSSWEKAFMVFCSMNDNIIKVNSEGMKVKYNNPVTGKVSTYYLDFMIETKDNKIWLVEIKPRVQRFPPKKPKSNIKNLKKASKANKRYIKAVETYAINQAKWKATEILCEEKGWNFIIIDETHLFP